MVAHNRRAHPRPAQHQVQPLLASEGRRVHREVEPVVRAEQPAARTLPNIHRLELQRGTFGPPGNPAAAQKARRIAPGSVTPRHARRKGCRPAATLPGVRPPDAPAPAIHRVPAAADSTPGIHTPARGRCRSSHHPGVRRPRSAPGPDKGVPDTRRSPEPSGSISLPSALENSTAMLISNVFMLSGAHGTAARRPAQGSP